MLKLAPFLRVGAGRSSPITRLRTEESMKLPTAPKPKENVWQSRNGKKKTDACDSANTNGKRLTAAKNWPHKSFVGNCVEQKVIQC